MNRVGVFARRTGMAAAAVLAVTVGLPLTGTATSGTQWVMVGDYTETHQTAPHPCGDGTQGCYEVITFHVPAHNVLLAQASVGITSARACTRNYVYPWVQYVQYVPAGEAWYVRMDNEDWYDGCSSAGNVYVNPSCGAYWGWNCSSSWKGAFWDPGRGANTDWNDRDTTFGTDTSCTKVRTFTKPSGSVTWATYSTFDQGSCGG